MSVLDLSEDEIAEQFRRIAFDGDKDSDRMKALEWLSEWLERKNTSNQVLGKLDEVLAELRK
jgi:hypothetical protein